jgi:hypothetical protein
MAKNKSWREIYIKILLEGPGKAEYGYAAELINDGYANGKYIKNNSGSGDPIAHLQWSGPTTKGREYLDDLQTKVRRNSFLFRLWSALVVIASWAIGFATDFFIQWFGHP